MRSIVPGLFAVAFAASGCGSSSSNNHAAAGASAAGGAGGTSNAVGGSQNSDAGSGGGLVQAKGVVIMPKLAVVSFAGAVQFMGVVTGSPMATVVWSMQEKGDVGSVADNGRYTAPKVAGTFHVVGTSSDDSSLTGTAAVTVTAPEGTPPDLVPGVWKDITPPAPGFADTFGSTALEISPIDPRTIYASVDTLGIWKTTDAGSNWKRLGAPPGTPVSASGGMKTSYLDSPVRIKVDPGDPKHLIATEGVRGMALGFWESNDGGDTWEMPKGFFDITKDATMDVTAVAIDPTDFKHILLGSHSPWQNGKAPGIMETTDGGANWILHEGQKTWPIGSLGVSFLYDPATKQGDPNTWIVAMDGDGFWRTKNAGGHWDKVSQFNTAHGGAQIYYAKDGTIYSGAANFPLRSHDNGLTWEQLSTNGLTNWYYYTIVGDGDTLYTQLSYTGDNGGQGMQPYMSSPETDGGTWTPYQAGAQKFNNGPALMRYDAANGIMYSANWRAGIWALKVIKP